jgi:NAD(P)-dependent dehydrogenase (short-subunit alcohol dehydrogenase family)
VVIAAPAGRVAAVTGAAAGIGAACARALAREGATVAVIDRDAAGATQVAADLGDRAVAIAADVSDGAQVASAFALVAERLGGLDVLVCSAGIQRYGTVETVSEDEWDEVLGVNLRGAFLAAKHAVPLMRARGGGSVVLVGSAQSIMGAGESAHYVASKHGLLGLTRALALDHAPDRIRANCVLPGTVDTPMLHRVAGATDDPAALIAALGIRHPLGRIATADEIASVVAFLAGDGAAFITGAAIPVDGGLTVPVGGYSAPRPPESE